MLLKAVAVNVNCGRIKIVTGTSESVKMIFYYFLEQPNFRSLNQEGSPANPPPVINRCNKSGVLEPAAPIPAPRFA